MDWEVRVWRSEISGRFGGEKHRCLRLGEVAGEVVSRGFGQISISNWQNFPGRGVTWGPSPKPWGFSFAQVEGPKKIPRITPEQEIFATTYYEFPGNFTTNLKDSKKFLQLSLGVSTQYDEQVMANVDSHQLSLRSEILTIMSTFSADDIAGREGKQKLADALKEGINEVLVKVEGFGGVENVHFTSFVLQ